VSRLVAAALAAGLAFLGLLGSEGRPAEPVQPESALDASAFVNSVGVNVHFAFADGPYGKRGAIGRLIRYSGVRHLRDGLVGGRTDICRFDRSLAQGGVRFTFISPPHPTRDALQDWATCTGPAIEAFEGINEYDISHPASDSDWVATLRVSQEELYREVKADAALSHLTVIGPSLTSVNAAGAVGDLSASLDEGNTHDYFGGHEPETGGWGFGGYGSIPYNLGMARQTSGAKPVVATETGYATPPAPRNVDEATQAAYVPRMFLAQAAAGIARTFEYELVDDGPAPFDTMGLVRGDLTPKPAFRALVSLLRELRSERRASARALTVDLADAPPDTRRMLFIRDDGTYVLALWRSSAMWDPRFERPLQVDDVPVSLRVGVPLDSARVVTVNAAGERVAAPLRLRPASVALQVGPRVTFVELRTANAS